MLGDKPTSQALGTKAAETKGLLPFVLSLLETHRPHFPPGEIECLIGAGAALLDYIHLIDNSPKIVPPTMLQKMYDAVKKHIALSRLGNVPLKPKAHLLLHMVSRSEAHGNPSEYATFTDESISQILKGIAEAAHRSVWELRILNMFAHAEGRRAAKRCGGH